MRWWRVCPDQKWKDECEKMERGQYKWSDGWFKQSCLQKCVSLRTETYKSQKHSRELPERLIPRGIENFHLKEKQIFINYVIW